MLSFKDYFYLNEISQREIDGIKNLLEIDPRLLPFDKIFKGRYRIVDDNTLDYVHPALKSVAEALGRDYEFKFEEGVVQRKGSGNAQKIGKFITNLYNQYVNKNQELDELIERVVTQELDKFKKTRVFDAFNVLVPVFFKLVHPEVERLKQVNTPWAPFNQYDKGSRFVSEFIGWLDKQSPKTIVEYFKKYSPAVIKHILQHELTEDLFGMNLNNLIQDIAEAYANVSSLIQTFKIVYSRHPIDVLRMSDFAAIQSCHSAGGDYFKCAVQEARAGGLIAYLVNMKQFNSIKNDLQDDEIFKDSDRGINGITPDGRIRLRRFTENTGKIEDIFIPEDRVYGKYTSGGISYFFKEQVMNWARSVQPIDEIAANMQTHPELSNLNNWSLSGGYYEDTPSEDLFDTFFNDSENDDYNFSIRFSGSASKDEIIDEQIEEIEGYMERFETR